MAAFKVGVVMGSQSDWPVMEHAVTQLEAFAVPYEAKVVSAHRTPDLLFEYAETARSRGLACIIAGAGGAAHLPGMLAAKSTVPVLGVPVPSKYLKGIDSLLSIVQMPKGIPVATFAIGEAGAQNAALYAISMLANAPDTTGVRASQIIADYVDYRALEAVAGAPQPASVDELGALGDQDFDAWSAALSRVEEGEGCRVDFLIRRWLSVCCGRFGLW